MTKLFSGDERFGLISQMRRASVSIAANIAEGFKKRSARDKINFYNISQGSAEELRYYCILAKDLGYVAANDHAMASQMARAIGVKMLQAGTQGR